MISERSYLVLVPFDIIDIFWFNSSVIALSKAAEIGGKGLSRVLFDFI